MASSRTTDYDLYEHGFDWYEVIQFSFEVCLALTVIGFSGTSIMMSNNAEQRESSLILLGFMLGFLFRGPRLA